MSEPPKDEAPRGGLRPTNPATLVLVGVLTFAVSWYFVKQYFGDIPNVTWLAGLTMAGLAVVEAIAARTTRARVEQRPRAGRLNPLLVARFVVLAKASSMAAAIFAGAYGGVAVWALSERDRLTAAAQNLPPAVAGVVGALALVAAALLLERACRVPEPPEDEDKDGPTAGPAAPRR
jgi:drug/metabolite transporter (DMT)-like permease